MCGIVAIVGASPVARRLVDALKMLEYRGYDSAGIATVCDDGFHRLRAAGKLVCLEQKLAQTDVPGLIGIAHTRWATHGAPTEANAHPHIAGDVAVVHNGIIENFSEIRDELVADGFTFSSQTDTEVVAHLLVRFRQQGLAHEEAVRAMLDKVRGSYAFAILFKDLPGTLFAARLGPPLAVGYGRGEAAVGSDIVALEGLCTEVSHLEDGDFAIVGVDRITIQDRDGAIAERPRFVPAPALARADKGGRQYFMEKEIHEQPEVVRRTLEHYVDFDRGVVRDAAHALDVSRGASLAISACGTAYFAGLVGKYWFERFARLPVEIDFASEFRYREVPVRPSDVALVISQSGETADTLASLRYCRERGMTTGALVNAPHSTIAREAHVVLPIHAGPEIGVASTKAFTCQLAALAALAIAAGRQRGTLSAAQEHDLVQSLAELPQTMTTMLQTLDHTVAFVSQAIAAHSSAIFLGRGTNYPLAMEGALKLKEISYIHAEGYAAGELKHGPIALIDANMPVVVVAPHDRFYEKTVSNMQEVAARGGRIIFMTDKAGAARSSLPTLATIILPDADELLAPILFSLPLQMIAYQVALHRKADVDQPRNLAKSVTVE